MRRDKFYYNSILQHKVVTYKIQPGDCKHALASTEIQVHLTTQIRYYL